MKIKDLVEYLGGYEDIKVLDEEYNELVLCAANDLTEAIGDKFIGTIYTSRGMINIIALDKVKRKWYNRKRDNAE